MDRLIKKLALNTPVVAMALLIFSLCHAAEPSSQEGCLVSPQFGKAHGRAMATYINLTTARRELVTYDELLATVPTTERDKDFFHLAGELRCKILQDALSAHYFIGSTKIAAGTNAQLFHRLMKKSVDYEQYQSPRDLQQLVSEGFLSHLPRSPYPGGKWLSSDPRGNAEPGSVYYAPIATTKPRMAQKVGQFEGWILVVYGFADRKLDRPLAEDEIKSGFLGELRPYLNPLPTNATFVWGQSVE